MAKFAGSDIDTRDIIAFLVWHATQPVLMNFSKPALAAGGKAS